jgi:hypothetical protein
VAVITATISIPNEPVGVSMVPGGKYASVFVANCDVVSSTLRRTP